MAPDHPDWNPRWSADGTEIAFYAYRSGNRDIWVMPSQGGPARQVTSHPATDWYPLWSPDGRDILFSSRRTPTDDLWVVDATGTGEPRFVASEAQVGSAAWSVDGRWLVFGRSNGVYRVARDGGAPELLAETSELPYSLRFSLDGRSIYYTVITGPREFHDVWKLSLADGHVSRVTQLEGRRGGLGSWLATDGRHVYFSWRDDVGDIWVMDVVSGPT